MDHGVPWIEPPISSTQVPFSDPHRARHEAGLSGARRS